MMKVFWTVVILCIAQGSYAQSTAPNAAELYHEIKKLNVLGTALYLAAHPDDENQRLISYLANERGLHTTYLSLTRGDGGQNLIGPEIREELGVIRTQELLAARAIDGGNQLFTRANDFGYSKHPHETFSIWQKEDVLSDLVFAIRRIRPDIIVHRFDHKTPGKTHGHHTGSAMLGVEAFDIAGDKNSYPEHLKYVDPWQPQRSFFNTSWWFYGSREKFAEADKSNLFKVDIGTYYPLLGKSNNEIAYAARSMHRCQGFGATLTRGTQEEWVEYLKGVQPTDNADPLSGLDLSWTRVEGGERIKNDVQKIIDQYNFENPSASVPDLVSLYQAVGELSDPFWKKRKQEEIKSIIVDAMGLYLEARAEHFHATPSSNITVELESTNRSDISASIKRVRCQQIDTAGIWSLNPNEKTTTSWNISLPEDAPYSGAFWLKKPGALGIYDVEDPFLRNEPEGPAALSFQLDMTILGTPFTFDVPVVHRWRDPAYGERYRPFEIVPPLSVSFTEDVIILKDNNPRVIAVEVNALQDNISTDVALSLPDGWSADPETHTVELKSSGEIKKILFTVTPPSVASEIKVGITATHNNTTFKDKVKFLSYDHIKTQMIIQPAATKIVKLDINIAGNRIGYIPGAGDKIPEGLEAIGFSVETLDINNISVENIQEYDAVILGVRAFNTVPELKFKNQVLFDYVHQGGTVIVQYNTRHRLVTEEIAPMAIKLSRDRVTDEFAVVTHIVPDHPALNTPNKITESDWQGWVQERGLYFPESWDASFTPLLEMADPEMSEPTQGSLLICKHGEGNYVYTGLSFFREFPAGVPGAYRLLANLIAL